MDDSGAVAGDTAGTYIGLILADEMPSLNKVSSTWVVSIQEELQWYFESSPH